MVQNRRENALKSVKRLDSWFVRRPDSEAQTHLRRIFSGNLQGIILLEILSCVLADMLARQISKLVEEEAEQGRCHEH